MIYRVTLTANVWIEAGSEDEALTCAQRIDKENLDYLYFAELDEHEHHWVCSDMPGLFNCNCGAEAIWDRHSQKVVQYIHDVYI